MACIRKITAGFLSLVLAVGLLPMPALAVEGAQEDAASQEDASSAASVAESLTSDDVPSFDGSYVEGEVIALVAVDSNEVSLQSTDDSSDGSDLLARAESLMSVSTSTLEREIEKEAETSDEDGEGIATLSLSSADDSTGTLVLVTDYSKTTEQIIEELEADPRVVYAEPNYTLTSNEGDSSEVSSNTEASSDSELSVAAETTVSAADATSLQWAESNDGHFSGEGTEGVDIGYSDWNSTTGYSTTGDEVVVAVVDTGVDVANPDLSNKMWTGGDNEALRAVAEAYGGSADMYGASFTAGTTSYTGLTSDHGTHVAGIIAAEWNNSGTSGISQNARIMSVRFGSGLDGVVGCMDYMKTAVEQGVNLKVANNSWTSGASSSKTVDTVVYELGKVGVVSVFGSANSSLDADSAESTVSTLADNPYVIVANSINSDGAMSGFSNYGEVTTDVMAPGGGILSTVFSNIPSYFASLDPETVALESFDSESNAWSQQNPIKLYRDSAATEEAGETTEALSLEGDSSYAVSYARSGTNTVYTNSVNLSESKPAYISISYKARLAEGSGTSCMPDVSLQVLTVNADGTSGWTSLSATAQRSADEVWGMSYAALPENTDWENFQLSVTYSIYKVNYQGGRSYSYADAGTVYFDCIGFGSNCVPYAYMTGTSMASPAAAGVAALLAEAHSDESAEKIAARVKSATTYNEEYEGLCSTAGMLCYDADGSDKARPALVSAEVSDGQLSVTGYFFGADPSVELDGTSLEVLSYVQDEVDSDKVTITAKLPDSYTGGQVKVKVVNGSLFGQDTFYFGNTESITNYYDQVNLSVAEDLTNWDGWQLVGFGGYIYVLPQSPGERSYSYVFRYDPVTAAWEQVALPEQEGFSATAVSGAVVDGRLITYITYGSSTGITQQLWELGADGTWTQLYLDQNQYAITGVSVGVQLPALAGLASDGTELYLVGGADLDTNTVYKAVSRLDLSTGKAYKVANLQSSRLCPNVTCSNGTLAIAAGKDLSNSLFSVGSVEYLSLDELPTVSSTADPSALPTSKVLDYSSLIEDTGELAFGVAGVDGGIMIAGAVSKNGTADTYMLSDSGLTLTEYSKRASDVSLLYPVACAYNGSLYVLSSALFGSGRVFSATEVSTSAVSLNEVTIDAVADQSYTGSALTPQVTVRLGSSVLTEGTDYTVSYTNNTAVGMATVTITGMGGFSGTRSITFAVTEAAGGGGGGTDAGDGDGAGGGADAGGESEDVTPGTSEETNFETATTGAALAQTSDPLTGTATIAFVLALTACVGAAVARRQVK